MKSIAFYNNKGGVGKTTSAINVSYELAKNSKVLGNKTLKSKIPFSRVIKNSISGGLTAGEYMGWTNAAKSYADLAAEIRERV